MLLRPSIVLASLSLATASVAGAQGCNINSESPALIRGVRGDYTKLIDAQAVQADKRRHFASGLQRLTEEYRDDQENQIARWFLVGKLYVGWLSLGQEGRIASFEDIAKKQISTRGETGFTLGDKKAKHDLFMALDSAFNKVETLQPGCVDSTNAYRERVYTVVYNKARDLLKAKSYDSAIVLARRSLVAAPKSPNPINLIANAYFEKGDMPGYRAALARVTTLPGNDSVTVDIRLNAIKNLAVMSLNDAREKTGDTQKALTQDAIDRFHEYLKIRPGDPEVTSGLSGALLLMGDTVAARQITEQMLSHPEQYSGNALFGAATAAYNSSQYDNAIKFYEAGLKKNPFHRDALFSLVSTLIKTQDFDKAINLMPRVLALDPSNQRNFQQMASALQGAMRATNDAARKSRLTDSILMFMAQRDSEPTWAAVTAFEVKGDSIALTGEMHNMTSAPRSQQIDFEFLNAEGAVVAKASENVKDVPANKAMLFTMSAKGPGVVAWRYKPFKQ